MPERGEANQVRALVLEMVERHDREFHNGEPCVATRVAILAFVAHSVGIESSDVVITSGLRAGVVALGLAGALREYEAGHQHGPHRHGLSGNGDGPGA